MAHASGEVMAFEDGELWWRGGLCESGAGAPHSTWTCWRKVWVVCDNSLLQATQWTRLT
jgi:hypothetical protein